MDPPLTKEKGKVKFNGHYETSYSQKLLPGRRSENLNNHVDKRGVVCDRDGYIIVATTLVKMGGLIQTSLGMGKRYDTCSVANTVEIYTYW